MNPLNDTYYIALTFKVPKSELAAYSHHLRKSVIPVYGDLMDGIIDGYEIYKHKVTTEQQGQFAVWNILHLIQMTSKENRAEGIQALESIEHFKAAEMIRMEELFSTPDSNYPHPGARVRRRRLKPLQIVEYVDVENSALDEFRNLMIQGNGPAMRFILEQRKWCHSFTALETTEVLYHNEHYPAWNQLHIIALYPEAPFLYKRDFGEGLARSSGKSFEETFGRLKEIRHMLYKCISTKLQLK